MVSDMKHTDRPEAVTVMITVALIVAWLEPTPTVEHYRLKSDLYDESIDPDLGA